MSKTPFEFKLNNLVTNTFSENECYYKYQESKCNKMLLLYIENKVSNGTALIWVCENHIHIYEELARKYEDFFILDEQEIFTLRLLLNE